MGSPARPASPGSPYGVRPFGKLRAAPRTMRAVPSAVEGRRFSAAFDRARRAQRCGSLVPEAIPERSQSPGGPGSHTTCTTSFGVRRFSAALACARRAQFSVGRGHRLPCSPRAQSRGGALAPLSIAPEGRSLGWADRCGSLVLEATGHCTGDPHPLPPLRARRGGAKPGAKPLREVRGELALWSAAL
jgi:hypothetical protein